MQLAHHTDPAALDAVFSALADPKRRAILTRLLDGDSTVGALVEPLEISQPAVTKHLKVLENAGLVERRIERQTRPVQLNADKLAMAIAWLEDFRTRWDGRLDRLDQLLKELDQKD